MDRGYRSHQRIPRTRVFSNNPVQSTRVSRGTDFTPGQCLTIECALFDGNETPKVEYGLIDEGDVAGWLQKTPFWRDQKPPASSALRLACKRHQRADETPFEDLQEINKSLGLSASHAYLDQHDAGLCGQALTETGQPGAVPCVHPRSIRCLTDNSQFSFIIGQTITVPFPLS
jgi:hypothetical protein